MSINDLELGAILMAEKSGTVPTTWIIAAKWQHGLYGSFYKALCETIAKADDGNALRLAGAYPDEVAAIKGWQRGTLATEMRDYCDRKGALAAIDEEEGHRDDI